MKTVAMIDIIQKIESRKVLGFTDDIIRYENDCIKYIYK